ncbi:MAG: RiPP maturation radical SAM protein 1 [Candidatus Nitronauta litoralis]|uniref:RiPP maturation radical SAM protein 1 n=1 Tax=Candidatus Nitronauta litoralis TaxID=2705533 RepID=A0A7T0BUY1_9BACT|nr:MAG: RiPP maturation radical SAM protein 1 [Candidatus Nitronauta litoralis]
MPRKVALINMPFGFHIYPSIQLGTVSTLLKESGHEAKSYYLNLHFAHQIGMDVYKQLCEERFLIGEWLFSHLLFGDSPKNREYADQYRFHLSNIARALGRPEKFLLEVKEQMVPEFLNWAVGAIDWSQYDIVGFTSTFNQNLASVTLAKLIKERHPQVKIMFGGSNFDSEMGLEYFRAFTWIDYVVSGEAEHVLPPLMKALETGGAIPPGVVHRVDGDIRHEENHENFTGFKDYGPPDYDDYFEQVKEIDPHSPLLDNPIVLYETARGCWWGEKHHCTFCGLNASTMEFRSRSMDQVHHDIAHLSKRYDTYRFRLVDNILEIGYIEGVFGEFAKQNYDLEFFIEVKSNLTKKQIELLAKGGVNVVQPGIESFSYNQLREMDKGVKPIQNIFCLKWALYYGMDVTWSILTGFPLETNDDFRQQIDLLKSIFHLQPPISVGNIWLERFSPYFSRPEEYGVTITGPGEAYPYVYDGEKLDLMKVAYDFEFETERKISPALVEELQQTVDYWKARHQSENMPFLFYSKSLDFVTVYDNRTEEGIKQRFEGAAARVIDFCNEGSRTLEQIRSNVQESGESAADLEAVVEDLIAKRLIYREGNRHITLALPQNSRL